MIIEVYAEGRRSGTLSKAGNLYSFTYESAEASAPWVSLTMPFRLRSWNWENALHPIFEMNLPEGYLFDLLRRQLLKEYDVADDFSLLCLLAANVRGRLEYRVAGEKGNRTESPALPLDKILRSGEEDLFAKLLGLYLERSFVSGVQPKVLARLFDKSALATDDYIVKTWGDEYPNLAENEFFCLSAARRAGLPVPAFHLSDDRKFLVVERFDKGKDGEWRGFEEVCVLQGKNKIEKYSGSYEQVARTVELFSSAERKIESMRWLFGMLCLSVLVRNGDAHLKNFGILYGPGQSDRVLAPVYDVVTTTAYIFKDRLALTFGGRKYWPGRRQLVDFGVASCGLASSDAGAIYDKSARAVKETLSEMASYVAANPGFARTGERMMAAWNAALDGEPRKDGSDEI